MVILLLSSKTILFRKLATLPARSEVFSIIPRTKAISYKFPVSTSALKMSPIPTVVVGRSPDIAKAVREGLLPEYEGKCHPIIQ
jgi:hypothetical protein